MKINMKRLLSATTLVIIALFALSFIWTPQVSARPICADGTEATADGTCPSEKAASCFSDWNNGSPVKGSDAAKKYNSSGCDKSDGGTCTTKESKKDGKTHLNISCKKPAKSSDSGSDGSQYADEAATAHSCDLDSCDIIDNYVNPLIKVLSVLVGVAAVIGIIFGAIQVSMSAGDPQKAASGKNHIRNAIIAIVAYVLLFVVLNWVVPGGIL
jgi:hypothetical protein